MASSTRTRQHERRQPISPRRSLAVAGGGGGGERWAVSAGTAPSDALDADKNGKVTPDEVATYYRDNGLAPFQIQIDSAPANPLGPAAAFLAGEARAVG
jgi:hypothetical protein